MTPEDSLRSLSLDYLNLLINGEAFSDVTFTVEGRLVHAHRCILAARSLFFRKFFCSPDPPSGLLDPVGGCPRGSPQAAAHHPSRPPPPPGVIPVSSVGYEVFLLVLQFLYSGQVSIVPQKHEPRPNCGNRGCWHTHCTSAVDLALDTLAAARSFGVEQLALLTQKQLASMVEKASIEDVMKVLIASRKQEMHQLWTTCSHLVAKSGLPPEVLAKHIPIDVVAKIEELRLNTAAELEDQKIRRMRRALDSSDVELVKLMVMGEGLNLDAALALHYAVENSDVNHPAGPNGKTPLHLAAEMVSPDMVAVLLDHHADPTVRTADGITPLDVLRTLTSDFLFKGAVPGLAHIEPNKLRLCLELVQSAALVISREEAGNANANTNASSGTTTIYPPMCGDDHSSGSSGNNMGNINLDSRVYLNLGTQMGSRMDEDDQSSRNSQRETMNLYGSQGLYRHSHDF
ncbi:hypothetical protein BT93_K1101 [Corymbia citriodora subsp. variegata]|nr:hypothetical protein BT93_K1101 [Corymbia citriodora subsp. variegata]